MLHLSNSPAMAANTVRSYLNLKCDTCIIIIIIIIVIGVVIVIIDVVVVINTDQYDS